MTTEGLWTLAALHQPGVAYPRNAIDAAYNKMLHFDELVLDASLPTVPSIRQSVRLYDDLKMVDVENVIDKQEMFEPEGVYFAFPFDVPKPTTRVEIAEAILRLNLPRGRTIARAFRANCLEVERQPLEVSDVAIRLGLKPNEIATVGVDVK